MTMMESANSSGIKPFGTKVLVMMDEVSDKMGKSGILHKTDAQKIEDQYQQIFCTIVEKGSSAFMDMGSQVPLINDRVMIGRYCGQFIEKDKTKDGRTYRVINDKDVWAILS